ncbi:MAG: hypothetical protein KGJ90_04605 [Patescibacteria group bacterium]|nr:hypothetical protein [Patescibacteria group bacterium]
MSNVPISQLPLATLPLTGSEPFPVVQGGVTVKVPVNQAGVNPTIISNIAALRSNTLSINQVYLQGYYTNGDGGEGSFYYNSSDNSSSDNGGTIIVDAANHRYYRQTEGGAYSIKWFGAKGDNSTDDTVAMQAAINAAAALAGGNDVYAPRGTFITSSGLSIPNAANDPDGIEGSVRFFGTGIRSTIIKGTGNNAVFLFNGTSGSSLAFASLEKLTIAGSWNSTSGSGNTSSVGISLNYGYRNTFRDVQIWSCYAGFYSQFSYECEVSNVNCDGESTGTYCYNGFFLDAVSAGNNNNAFKFVDCVAYDCRNNGWNMIGFAGGTWTSCRAEACVGTGWMLGGSGVLTPVQFGNFDNCIGDSCGTNWSISSNSDITYPSFLQFSNCWSGNSSNNGWSISGIEASQWTGCISDDPYGDGFSISGCSHLSFVGCQTNGYNISNNYSCGFRVFNSTYCTINSNIAQTSYSASGGLSVIESGTSNNNTFVANNFQNGGTRSGVASTFRSNIGLNPVGPHTISPTGSPFTYSNNVDEFLYISGSGITNVSVAGTSISSGAAVQTLLSVPQTLVVVYSGVAPTILGLQQ